METDTQTQANINLTQLRELAETAARKAGELLKGAGESLKGVNFEDNRDVKLQADEASEALVRELLEPTGLPIIGEEGGGDETLMERDELYWVVDPLDGTYNYLRGQAPTGVIIALMRGMHPVIGITYNFVANIMYSACLGDRSDTAETGAKTGLLVNGTRVNPTWAASIQQACMCTGFSTAFNFSDTEMGDLIAQMRQFKKVRMLGTAAIAAVYVATGQADVYFEDGTRWWDIAGGVALVAAAGGAYSVERVPGLPFGVNFCLAGKSEWLHIHEVGGADAATDVA